MIAFESASTLPTSLAVLIYPLADEDVEDVTFGVDAVEGQRIVLRVTRPTGGETFAFAPQPAELPIPGLDIRGRAACHSQAGEQRRLYVVDGQGADDSVTH